MFEIREQDEVVADEQVIAKIVANEDGAGRVSVQLADGEVMDEEVEHKLHRLGRLELFLDELGEQVSEMHAAVMREDLERLEEIVEEVKRGAGSYGLRRITSSASKLDEELEQIDDLCELVQKVNGLANICKEVIGELDGQDDDWHPVA